MPTQYGGGGVMMTEVVVVTVVGVTVGTIMGR
jgi:hypothetical protein